MSHSQHNGFLSYLQSFIIMKDRMQAQGMDVRASLDGPDDGKARQMEMGAMDGGKMGGMGESAFSISFCLCSISSVPTTVCAACWTPCLMLVLLLLLQASAAWA
jgi:hypothetical protein